MSHALALLQSSIPLHDSKPQSILHGMFAGQWMSELHALFCEQSNQQVPSLKQTPPALGHVAAQSAAASAPGASGGASTTATSTTVASLDPSGSVTTSCCFASGEPVSFVVPPSTTSKPVSARPHAVITDDAMANGIHLDEPTPEWLHNADDSGVG